MVSMLTCDAQNPLSVSINTTAGQFPASEVRTVYCLMKCPQAVVLLVVTVQYTASTVAQPLSHNLSMAVSETGNQPFPFSRCLAAYT